ncbi:MAG: nucleotidyltransferase domain-containing protein [Atribacterota bacterium]|nr:nucleotidyltransferase domain-containing protein [Atribacterota bacterium]
MDRFKNKFDELKKIFVEEYRDIILLAYFFGSQLKGKTGPLSDYDIAILLSPEQKSFQFKYKLQHELTNIFNFEPIDLVILNDAPIELKYHVIAAGQIIYQKDSAIKVEFEADTLSRYFDYLPVLNAQRQDILDFKPKGVKYDRRIQRYRAALRETEKKLNKIRTS